MRLGKWADYNLCVSQAMQVDLVNKFGITKTPHVLYDKATKKFQQIDSKEKHSLFRRINLDVSTDKDGNEQTLFTEFNPKEGTYQYRQDRPVFCLSSTSYTPDEDFMILIQALDTLQAKINELSDISKSFTFPKLQFIVTGKGPLKD